MARIITIANNKGGVGKTTTAINMGAALHRRGFAVLLVDFDSQASLSQSLRVAGTGATMYEAVTRDTPQYIEPTTTAGGLAVIPGSRSLSHLRLTEARASKALADFLQLYRSKFDIIIIDTPPAEGALMSAALAAADEVIITMQPQYLALDGLLKLWGTVGADKPKTVLINQYYERKGLHRNTAELVRNNFPCFLTSIRDNIAIAEAPAAGVDIFSYDARSKGAQDYAALVEEYLKANHIIRHK